MLRIKSKESSRMALNIVGLARKEVPIKLWTAKIKLRVSPLLRRNKRMEKWPEDIIKGRRSPPFASSELQRLGTLS